MKYKPSEFLLKGEVGSLTLDTCSLEEAWVCYVRGSFGLMKIDVSNDVDMYKLDRIRNARESKKK